MKTRFHFQEMICLHQSDKNRAFGVQIPFLQKLNTPLGKGELGDDKTLYSEP